jgi:capsular polysaccharide biosynthesis protein
MNRQKMANVSVIRSVNGSKKPVRVKKALNIILGMILGTASGRGFAFSSEFTYQSSSTYGNVEKGLAFQFLQKVAVRKINSKL